MMMIGLLAAPFAPLFAADEQGSGQLGVADSPIELPSLGRLAFGFALTVALTVGSALVIRRWGSRWLRESPVSGMKAISRASLAPGLRATLLEVDGRRVLIVEGRNQLQLLPLSREEGAPGELVR